MSREIKFRALRDDMGDCNFVYGSLVYLNGEPKIQKDQSKMLFTTCIKGTEGQYTGLKDKNGTEIYEGDIVKASRWADLIGIVTYGTATYDSGYYYTQGYYLEWIDNSADIDGSSYYLNSESEVIGNIHEDPELI